MKNPPAPIRTDVQIIMAQARLTGATLFLKRNLCRMPAVRRYFVLLLLFLLPFQSLWAAAASYCQHENDTTTQHFGHHEHECQAVADEGEGTGLSTGEQDCNYCHLGCAKPLSQHTVAMLAAPTLTVSSSPPRTYRSHIPAGIERPNWSLAA